MKKKTQKWVRVRHKVYTAILRYPVMFVFWLLYGFKHKKIKLSKNENAFIISNHQTQFDPILVSLGVNKPVYYVATDTLFSNKFVSIVTRLYPYSLQYFFTRLFSSRNNFCSNSLLKCPKFP